MCRSPGLPCAMVFTVSFVLSSGSDALLPPSPPAFARCADRSAATSPRGLGASYRAPGPHDFSVRAHLSWVLHGWRALTVKAMRGRCQRRVAPRPSPLTVARPAASSRADAVAATASRPASRDDRETPLVAGGTARFIRQNRNSVNSNIFARRSRPRTGVFCPSGSTRGGGGMRQRRSIGFHHSPMGERCLPAQTRRIDGAGPQRQPAGWAERQRSPSARR